MVHVDPNKPTYYTTMQAQIVVMHVRSYDVLVGGVVLYPLNPLIFGKISHTIAQGGKQEPNIRLRY